MAEGPSAKTTSAPPTVPENPAGQVTKAMADPEGETEPPLLQVAINSPNQEIQVIYMAPDESAPASVGSHKVILPDGTTIILPIGTIRADDPLETIEELIEGAAIGICEGSLIAVPGGTRLVEALNAGDQVQTRDGGPQTIRWIGKRRVKARGALAPIVVKSGALGQHDALTVMPQQRILICDWRADLLFGEPEVLVPARYLVDGDTVVKVDPGEVEVFLLLLDGHHVLTADRCLTETFRPSEQSLLTMDDASRADILARFPTLRADPVGGYGRDVRPTLRRWEVKYLMK